MTKEKLNVEKVPLLAVYKEGTKIKLRTSRNISTFELLGFLVTYIRFLKYDLLVNMGENNTKDFPSDNFFDEFDE